MTISVRAARAEDVQALVRLRLANAERHLPLDPDAYRIPNEAAVRAYFEDVLARGAASGAQVAVAEWAGEVVGMVEVVMMPEPPEHQILVAHRAAQIHTTVLDRQRGRGVGAVPVVFAERVAAEQGIRHLYAGILAANAGAVRFYAAQGFGDNGISLRKTLFAADGDDGPG